MKVLSLISTILLAVSLAGAVQAAPEKHHVATATIELAQCDQHAHAACGIGAPAAKPAEVELNALPPADPKQQQVQQQAADPASPVPEPHNFVLLMLGLVVLGVASRRRATSAKFSG